MKKLLAVLTVTLVVAASAGVRSAAAGPDAQQARPQPWGAAEDALKATLSDVQASGVLGVQAHVTDLESSLANGDHPFGGSPAKHGETYVLADGTAETLLVLSVAAAAQKQGQPKGSVVALDNPYPAIAVVLGSYYDEVGKPEEAVRVLDRGLALTSSKGTLGGAHLPILYAERGAALTALNRWQDALDDYESGLAVIDLAPRDNARLLRGKGFALTELGKLDLAEQAYRDSLKLDPENAIATHELAYLAHLKSGGARAPTALTIPGQSPKP